MITSEVHASSSCTKLSRFAFKPPEEWGDQQRRHLIIHHETDTELVDVGLQVWNAAFLLGDYILARREDLRGKILLELGGGPGLVSILASLLPIRAIYCTDYKQNIVDLAYKNFQANIHLASSLGLPASELRCRCLDWTNFKNPRQQTAPEKGWTDADTLLLSTSGVVFLASDVVYDDELTEALFACLQRLMRPGETVWVTLEKRFNFSIREMDLAPTGYALFRSNFYDVEVAVEKRRERLLFEGRSIALASIPQSFAVQCGADLELWELTRCS